MSTQTEFPLEAKQVRTRKEGKKSQKHGSTNYDLPHRNDRDRERENGFEAFDAMDEENAQDYFDKCSQSIGNLSRSEFGNSRAERPNSRKYKNPVKARAMRRHRTVV